MTRRWIGGVFGNTVGSDTAVLDITGVFSMEQQYYIKQEGGWELPPIGTDISNPATTPAALIAAGFTTNGYYWLKGTSGNSNSNAKLFYCFLNSSYNLGAGWAIIAHHDASKASNASHQPRPTAWSNFIGYDNAAGNGNTQGDPGQSDMVSSKSFSCDATHLPFTKFAHVAYDNSNFTSTLAYYGGTFNSSQTIPNSAHWAKEFDTKGVTFNSYGRRLSYTAGSNPYSVEGIGCFNSTSTAPNNGVVPYINGHSAATADYPVYIGSWTYTGGTNSTATFSWHDSSSSSGWDDFQDGSGMGDSWGVEGQSANFGRGNASYIIVG